MGRTAVAVSFLLAGFLGGSCGGDSTGIFPLDPGDASYSTVYDPPRIVGTSPQCDRLMTYAIMSLGRRFHTFELSINLIDNCSRSGGGYTYWESLILGDYTSTGGQFVLIPDTTRMPRFAGTFDGTYVRFTLPANPDSLAPTPVEMQLGPRQPF